MPTALLAVPGTIAIRRHLFNWIVDSDTTLAKGRLLAWNVLEVRTAEATVLPL